MIYNNKYKICKNCVMDTTDSKIIFDENGICDHCNNYYKNLKPAWDKLSENKLAEIAKEIKKEKGRNDFDCIIGLSGGLDSSYTAFIAKEIMGLNPLLLHVDAGWNTQQAVSNIQKIVDGLGLELYTEVINWESMKELQKAFLRSGIPDQDLPQDYAFFSSLYKFARKHKIKYVLTGSNFSTECCREPEEWGAYIGIDKKLTYGILNKFGNPENFDFPLIDVFEYRILYKFLYGMKVIYPCNYVNYNKEEVESLLKNKFGWEKFKHKHHESRFTRFFEDFWLKNKFGYDKRKAHFSSLILTGQMKREEALERLKYSELSDEFHKKEFKYISKKIEMSEEELMNLFKQENKTVDAYASNKNWIQFGKKILIAFGLENRHIR